MFKRQRITYLFGFLVFSLVLITLGCMSCNKFYLTKLRLCDIFTIHENRMICLSVSSTHLLIFFLILSFIYENCHIINMVGLWPQQCGSQRFTWYSMLTVHERAAGIYIQGTVWVLHSVHMYRLHNAKVSLK